MVVTEPSVPPPAGIPKWLRSFVVLGALYCFLVGIKAIEASISAVGDDFARNLFDYVSNPISALFAGILVTVLTQSSTVTTATLVGLVGAGAMPLETAVPMVMGANIGTTVTSTIVALGHVRQGREFRLAFAAATMHDFFNILSVVVFVPLELATGFITRSAVALTTWLGREEQVAGDGSGSWLVGTINTPVDFIDGLLGSSGRVVSSLVFLAIALVLIFGSLALVTKHMRIVMAGSFERSFNTLLDRGAGLGALMFGLVMTLIVQSSSITTSIMVPMVAAGVMTLRAAFPVALGADLGTTATGLLASVAAARPEALTIALVHTLFNLYGIFLFYPIPVIRQIPIRIAMWLAEVAQRRKRWVLVYVVGVFLIIPAAGLFLL